MADQGADQDKSETATPFKLEEARKRGQVFKSVELNSLAVLSVALAATIAFSESAMRKTFTLTQGLLREAGRTELTIPMVTELMSSLSTSVLFLLLPFLLLVMAAGVVANFLQTGPVFSFTPLKPDFTRLNPATGLKRLFSMRSVYEGFKSMLKLGLLAAVLFWMIWSLLPDLLMLTRQPLGAYPDLLIEHASFVLFVLLLGLLGLALMDLSFTRWEFMKKMRMSRRELKDEVKRREGDPQIRSKRREIQRAMRKKAASAGRIKDADVLITNPTHVAVALQYSREDMPAPKLISKGAGDAALKLRRAAFRHGIPVVENPPLARSLYRSTDLEQYIPEDSYRDVALVLRSVRKPSQERPS
ncbi:flagellar biosynthesis protein FlhB [Solimonas sp. SE-A11]|uniref:EscU/YscU/HrcU family type III secretion system export apparatus switch protein n=1 Tax=Solimonas sp. SE-A11 TaxID=3054954 RepID=UPI00259CC925|nr:EscU/YscU/HrcU family type III secretion system export apparatus switch protein [Solimonas sp. SE-A11]MDM4772902.1 EscU/YscU/HrcU family type III secretion system export apparatus switch protein [Solimonas sp. SE-A11]